MSMTTRQRHEDYSTSNVVRVLHPTRPLSPNNGATDVDNNLDYLLDDLQSSVTRSKNESSFSSNSRDVQYLSPSNTSTIIRERSISPGGENRRVYKTSHYEYSSSSNSGVLPSQTDLQKNINSLDTLLLDLKHERDASLDRDKNFSNAGIDSGLLEPNSRFSTTTRTYTSNSSDGINKSTLNREYNLSPVITTETTTHQSRTRTRSPAIEKSIQTKVSRDISYDSEPNVDNTVSSTSTINRSYNNYHSKSSQNYNTSSRSVEQQIVPYKEIVEVNSSDLRNELNDLPLDGNILPGPGTKVTTTIKTFTYEIPGDTQVSTNKHFKYQNDTFNTKNTTTFAERDIPPPVGNQTTIYKTENYNTSNITEGYPGYDRRPRSPLPEPISNQTVIYKRETRDTSSNTLPNQGNPPGQSTIIYKHDVTNTNTNVHHPPTGGVPVFPNDPNLPAGHPGPTHTYIYKKEVNNTKNTVYGPPGSGHPPHPTSDYPNNALPAQGYPNEPSSTTYKYVSNTSTTTRNTHGHPDDRQPLLAPFPTDDIDHSHVGPNPPKRLDDLLASLGDQNGRANEEPYTPRKEVNTSLATGKAVAIVEPKVPTKNLAGPPVYYPPNHELFAKSEQSAAAWRAQGGYANARGKYEYEAESKSKSSSKSGGAMVPVCLPLCCAMPCVIININATIKKISYMPTTVLKC
ncbi:hypothetical protein Bhyg_09580 [Pseudolycoriella hygida]|uniref:Uncharacterized protein n=1 Tax=Pseudolycoriella hygida TaxID=35572 RepID=A0A9Q0N6P4_9DIPT|nr:hypothetical protein Bhyg_09580 [Pseudolycoriella hygida]